MHPTRRSRQLINLLLSLFPFLSFSLSLSLFFLSLSLAGSNNMSGSQGSQENNYSNARDLSQEALWRLQLAAAQSQQIYVEQRPPSAFSGLVDYAGYSHHINTVTSSLSQQSFGQQSLQAAQQQQQQQHSQPQPLAPLEMLQAAQRYGTLRKAKQPPLPPQRKDQQHQQQQQSQSQSTSQQQQLGKC